MIPSTKNVLDIYNMASADDIRTGLTWYQDAHNFAHTLAGGNRGQFGYSSRLAAAAGIIAALSPMNGWENNKRKAAQFFAQDGDGTNIGLKKNVEKAIAIYNGATPLDILGGDKVRAFYATILDPQGDHNPVIDRHAFDIAVGMRTDDKARGALSRKGVYDDFAKCYREAALIVGIGASQMQAIAWTAWRNIHGINA